MINISKKTRHALALFAFSSLLGCTTQANLASPTYPSVVLRVYHTDTTRALFETLTTHYADTTPITWETQISNHSTLSNRLLIGEAPYFITQQLPKDPSLWAAPLAQDALVMVVHPKNSVPSLTLENIRRIYLGNITNWAELGGDNRDIVLFSREEGADVRAEFERLVMGQRRTSPNAQVLPSSEALMERIGNEEGGIGYVAFSQLAPATRAMNIEGVEPTQETLANLLYPLRLTVYIVGRTEPEREYRAFVGWAQSEKGQAFIKEQYVPLPR